MRWTPRAISRFSSSVSIALPSPRPRQSFASASSTTHPRSPPTRAAAAPTTTSPTVTTTATPSSCSAPRISASPYTGRRSKLRDSSQTRTTWSRSSSWKSRTRGVDMRRVSQGLARRRGGSSVGGTRRWDMSQLVFDQDTAQRLQAVYGTRDAIRRRGLARGSLAAAPGERVVDVGCGPGFFCAELAEEVGDSGFVLGLDMSAAMLALAADRCAGRGNVELREADAGSLPVDDGSFDAALCGQVLEYVPDATASLAEMRRILRPGGRVVVWDVDWATISIHSDDPALTERVLSGWDEHLTHRSLPRTLPSRLRAAGFENVGMQGHVFAA